MSMLVAVAVWLAIASAITFVLYGWDKNAATNSRRRVSEQTLLWWALLGGWPGAMLAASLFRHKTSKTSYRIRFAIVTAANLIALAGMTYLSVR
jgi:uncharacterized membrane protein YsdA (DUF1294 family)